MRWNASTQDVVDHLVFSGADTYDWYTQLDVDGDNQITIGMEDPDDCDTSIFTTMSANAVRLLIEQYVADEKPGYKVVARAIKDDDFDSDAADVALQWVLFGKVVYG